MKTAIVTGASRGIGYAISKRLLQDGYRVYGISRTVPNLSLSGDVPETDTGGEFIPIQMDLLNTDTLTAFCKEITAKKESIHILVNNAGIGCFGPHEELPVDTLIRMIRLNFEVPILCSRLLLRQIKEAKGQILNISSVTAQKESPFGCAYGASKSGLSQFSKNLFEEVRKSGVRVLTLHPDLTKTAFYDALSFQCADEVGTYIDPDQAADAALFMLNAPRTINIQDITLRPQKNQIIKKAKHPQK